MSDKYRESGVDLEAGYESVRLIKKPCGKNKGKRCYRFYRGIWWNV